MEIKNTFAAEAKVPSKKLPANSCDSHCHMFGPADRFPFVATRKFTPPDAPKELLYAVHRTLGISRSVIVQSALHGPDNSAVAEAIAHGNGHYLGVAVVPVSIDVAGLKLLASQGFRAVRFNFMKHIAGSVSIDEVVALTPRLAEAGMHLQVHFESALVHDLAPSLKRSAVTVVIDHMGRVDARLGPEHADFQALQRLLDDPRVRVKVSGVDRIDVAWPYPDGTRLARSLVEKFPDQCVWGTDWPHLNHHHLPDTAALVDLLDTIAPTSTLLDKLLVTNPQQLYQFNDSPNQK